MKIYLRVVKVEWQVTTPIAPRQIEGTIDGFYLCVHFRRNRLSIEILLNPTAVNPRDRQSILEINTPCFIWGDELKPIVRDALRLWAFSFYGERCKLEVRTKKRGEL
jgi:hypothetical protein